jgi:hypothetical protein
MHQGQWLNRIKRGEHDHTRVVRVPISEGHVFRSKERTPVLLLIETLDEGAEENQDLVVEEVKESLEGPQSTSQFDKVEGEHNPILSTVQFREEEKKEVNSSETDPDGESTTAAKDGAGNVENEDEMCHHTPPTLSAQESQLNATPKSPVDRKQSQLVTIAQEMIVMDDPVVLSSLHNRTESMPSNHSEISMSMPGSQDGIQDGETAPRRE